MKIALVSVYTVLGVGLFIYLFARHIRQQLRESRAENDNIVTQKLKMMRNDDGRHFIRFFLLLVGLFLFATSVELLITKF
jgi:hypothetical protein